MGRKDLLELSLASCKDVFNYRSLYLILHGQMDTGSATSIFKDV